MLRHIRNIRNKVKPWKRRVAAKMSRNKTWPEKVLWKRLKDKQLGVRIYAQSIIFGYIVDFWCPCGIVIEVDGKCHSSRKGYDKLRDTRLGKRGIKTMRFAAQEVINNCPAVVAIISREINRRRNEATRNKLVGRGR